MIHMYLLYAYLIGASIFLMLAFAFHDHFDSPFLTTMAIGLLWPLVLIAILYLYRKNRQEQIRNGISRKAL